MLICIMTKTMTKNKKQNRSFIEILPSFRSEAMEDRDVTFNQNKRSNVHYSGFPKYLQIKSNLHISISQSKLKHKYLPLDTL